MVKYFALAALAAALSVSARAQRPFPEIRAIVGTGVTLGGQAGTAGDLSYRPERLGWAVALSARPLRGAPVFVEVGGHQNRRAYLSGDPNDGGLEVATTSATFVYAALGGEGRIGPVRFRAAPRFKVPIQSGGLADLSSFTVGVLIEGGADVATVGAHPVSVALRYHRDISDAFESSFANNSFPTVEARVEVGL